MPAQATPNEETPPVVEPEGAEAGAEDIPAVVPTGITTNTNQPDPVTGVVQTPNGAVAGSLG